MKKKSPSAPCLFSTFQRLTASSVTSMGLIMHQIDRIIFRPLYTGHKRDVPLLEKVQLSEPV